MTDERIKEEFEKYLDGDIDTKATMFGYHYETNRKGSKAGYKNMAQGFYAGFRAAERLAKIEVLEEVLRSIRAMDEYPVDEFTCGKIYGYSEISDAIDSMLSDLKAALDRMIENERRIHDA
jgi:hypothetical protein